MKKLVKQIQSAILFDSLLRPAVIRSQFETVHTISQARLSGWSANATRQKLIYKYWFHEVPIHFATIIGFPTLAYFAISGWKNPLMFITVVFFVSFISFLTFYFFHYRPAYSSIFLPHLETVKEIHEGNQAGYGSKCRKAQVSNFALTLVYIAIDKTCELNSVQCNDEFAFKLSQIFGVDPGSLKKNLKLILDKKQPVSKRKLTEIENHFDEAFSLLESINFNKGISHLRALQQNRFSIEKAEKNTPIRN